MQSVVHPIWKRLLAFIYDGLIVTALVLISGLVSSWIAQGEAPAWLTRLIIVFRWVVTFGGLGRTGGQTAGMLAWRLRLVGLRWRSQLPTMLPLNGWHYLVNTRANGCDTTHWQAVTNRSNRLRSIVKNSRDA